jgi:hypothetical protein
MAFRAQSLGPFDTSATGFAEPVGSVPENQGAIILIDAVGAHKAAGVRHRISKAEDRVRPAPPRLEFAADLAKLRAENTDKCATVGACACDFFYSSLPV